MLPVKLNDKIYWVGAIDWDVRLFHDFLTSSKGSTYNAYLILDDKITLFDTVYKDFKEEFLTHLQEVVDPSKIDYMVVNHVEMDHTGALPMVMEIVKPEKLFCSPMGKKALLSHFHREDWPYEVVQTGQEISIGSKTVQFIEGRMLHWPDSMLSYIKEDKILISNDVFGQHLATTERFVDEIPLSKAIRHACKYYANIFMPYSPLIAKLLEELKKMNLEIDVIAPDHGLIWRDKDIVTILDAYDNWSSNAYKQRALIIFDTMYHSTEKMARAIEEGIVEEGVKDVHIVSLQVNHRSDILTDLLNARALIFGSSTLNNSVLPQMADMLSYLKGLRPKNKIGAAFGSYGWSGEALSILNKAMEEMKIEIIDPGIKVEYVPTAEDLKKCIALGQKIGRAIKNS